jgi:hypothetical protein
MHVERKNKKKQNALIGRREGGKEGYIGNNGSSRDEGSEKADAHV